MTQLANYPVSAEHPIKSIKELQFHLANAAAVELSTVPLYLYAAYSIKTSGYSQWSPGVSAFRTIRSVVIEEMLHLCLARNLLVAIGGDMKLHDPEIVKSFPTPMLHREPKLCLHLAPASKELMREVFIPLELPEWKPEGAWMAQETFDPIFYETLGEFYNAIEEGFKKFADKAEYGDQLFGDEDTKLKRSLLQYGRAYWNDDGGGQPIIVKDLTTAKQAINTIVEQGEGAKRNTVPLKPAHPTPGLDELTHYAKFKKIADGIDKIGDVWPVLTDPTRDQYNGSLQNLAKLFDAAYCYVLCLLDEIYKTPTITRDTDAEGHPIAKQPIKSERYLLERMFLAAMGGLLYPIADLIVRQPLDENRTDGPHAGPTFGYYEFTRHDKKAELLTLCEAVVPRYPSLGGDDSVLQLIQRLPSVDPPMKDVPSSVRSG